MPFVNLYVCICFVLFYTFLVFNREKELNGRRILVNKEIETLIEKKQWEQAWEVIADYEAAQPGNAELNVYKCL